mgnify:CR=1 FL=1
MAMMIADSDILIDALRGRDPAQRRIALELRTGRLATTAINVFELLSGARSEVEREKVERLVGALTILPIDDEASRRAAAVRRDLEAKGLPIGMADYLIAGVCLARGGILLPRNRTHFERVAELRLGFDEK